VATTRNVTVDNPVAPLWQDNRNVSLTAGDCCQVFHLDCPTSITPSSGKGSEVTKSAWFHAKV
jgi:hypothetical protein